VTLTLTSSNGVIISSRPIEHVTEITMSLLDLLPQDCILIICQFSNTIINQLYHSTLQDVFSGKHISNKSLINWSMILQRVRYAPQPSDPWYDLVSFYHNHCFKISVCNDLTLSASGVAKNPSRTYIIMEMLPQSNVQVHTPPGITIVYRSDLSMILECNRGMDEIINRKISDSTQFFRAGCYMGSINDIPRSIECDEFLDIVRSERLTVWIQSIYSEFLRRCDIVQSCAPLPLMIYNEIDPVRFMSQHNIPYHYPMKNVHHYPQESERISIQWKGRRWTYRESYGSIIVESERYPRRGDDEYELRCIIKALIHIHHNAW